MWAVLALVGIWVFIFLLVRQRSRESKGKPALDWATLATGVLLSLSGLFALWRYAVGDAFLSPWAALVFLALGAFSLGCFIWDRGRSTR